MAFAHFGSLGMSIFKKVVRKVAMVLALFYVSSSPSYAERTVKEFRIPSSDGIATISGQVDSPELGCKDPCISLIISGGVFFDRDGYMGSLVRMPEGTSFDSLSIYRALSNELTKRGIRVVRYDQRGVVGNPRTCIRGQIVSGDKYSAKCLLPNVRRTIHQESMIDDLQAVLNYVKAHILKPNEKIGIIGFSEGARVAIPIVLSPKENISLFVLVGAVLTSQLENTKWQRIDRVFGWLERADENNDRLTTNDEIISAHRSWLGEYIATPEPFFSPKGAWDLTAGGDAEKWLKQLFLDFKKMADEAPDGEHISGSIGDLPNITIASAKWLKENFTDASRVAELKSANLSMLFAYGEKDNLVSVPKSVALYNSLFSNLKDSKLLIVPNAGHSLEIKSSDPAIQVGAGIKQLAVNISELSKRSSESRKSKRAATSFAESGPRKEGHR